MTPNEPTASGNSPSIDPATGRARELEARVLAQAVQDPAFRVRLLADPKAVFAERGLSIPPEVRVQVVQETADQYYLVVPAVAERRTGISLSDVELENVAGGFSSPSVDTQYSGCASGTIPPGGICNDSQQTQWTGCASGQSGCVASIGCYAV